MKDNMISKVKEMMAENIFDFPQIDSDLEVWFVLEGKEFEVSNFKIRFGQGVDYKGQPQNETRGGFMIIELTQMVPDDIYKWAMTTSLRSGSVEFRSKTAGAPLKIVFTDAYCVNLDQSISEGTGLSTSLTISPDETLINGISMNNNWVK